jgi:hypothetical protein
MCEDLWLKLRIYRPTGNLSGAQSMAHFENI